MAAWNGRAPRAYARVALVVAVIAMTAVYKLVHLQFMATIYAAADYVDDGVDPNQIIVGLLCATIVAVVLPMELRSASDLLLWMTAALVVLPTVVISLSAEIYAPARGMTLVVAVGGLVLLAWVLRAAPERALLRGTSPSRYTALLLGLLLVLAPTLALVGGIRGINLDLSAAYDIRGEFKESGGGVAFQYAIAWFGTVLIPVTLAWGLTRRNVWCIGASLVATIVDYSLTGYRLVLLGPILVVAVYVLAWAAPRLRRYAATTVMWCITVVVLVTWALLPVSAQGLLLERTIFLPGKITAEYVLHYSESAPVTHWSYGILKGVFGAPVEEPARAIGQEYYLAETNANANPLADGFAAFDLFGVVVAVLFLGVLMYLVRAASLGREATFTIPAFTMTALYLTNVSVLTQATNGGLLFLILILAISPAAALRRTEPVPDRDRPAALSSVA